MPAIESNSSSELIFQNFAKGLSGHFLSERTSAVCSSPQLIRDNPTPFFVNKVVVQLSSLFKDDAHNANVVRFAIVNALAECKAQLAHVFSANSIIDNVLVVSHSTDIEARSLTLQMLASLAPVAKDNKQVHHLVVESLLSSHIEEFFSAIIALKEYVKLSTDICDMVVDRMSMMLLSQLTPEERKKQLISVIGSMRSSLQTTQSMFAVCIRLIKDEVLVPEHSEMLMDSMTDLAIATRFTIPDQISFLLDELVNCKITSFYICALRNIRHLAHHAHMWDKEAIEKLCHRQSVLPSALPLLILEYLRVLEVIAKNALPNHIDLLKNSVIDLSSYYGHTHLAVRISFMSLSTTVLAIGPVNSQHMKLLLNAFLTTLPLEMEKGLLKKLCRASIHLIRDCGIEQSNLWELLGLICSLPSNHQSLGVFLELFAQLSDTMTEVVAPIAEWADKMIQKGAHLSTEKLAFLVFSKDQEITQLADEWTKNDWIAYRVALLAMRTGHLRDVAFQLLEQIDRQNLSPSSLYWIQILRLICLSQPKEFSIAEVDKATESLRQANQIIKKLVIGSFAPKFLFVSRFITSFLSTQMIYGILLGGLGHFLVGTELLTNQEACEKALQVLKVAQRCARSAVEMWGSLSKMCFAADIRSLDALHMLGSTASLLNYGLQAIISNEEPAPVKIPLLDSTCTVRFRQWQLLEWAKTNFEMLTKVQTSETHRINEQSINHLMTVVKSLCMHRLGMPKYLFYQKCQFEIKLSVTPGTSGEYHASPNSPIPFKVTGLILTKGPIVPIETVIVTAIVQFAGLAGNDCEQSQTVNLKEKDYFNANFLLQFNQNCSVHFFVEFVDSERRQNWKSEANAMVRIQVRTPARIEH